MSNPHKGRTGIDRVIRATGFSLQGLRAAYRHESAFRQEFWLALPLLPASIYVGRGWAQIAVLGGSVILVLIVELLNSGLEAAIDRISFDHHDLSKRAKDYGSAAVMLSLVLCGVVWAAALWSRFGR